MMATATGGRCSTFCGPRSELITYFGAAHLFLGYDARGTIRIRCESVRAVRVAYVYITAYLPRIIPKTLNVPQGTFKPARRAPRARRGADRRPVSLSDGRGWARVLVCSLSRVSRAAMRPAGTGVPQARRCRAASAHCHVQRVHILAYYMYRVPYG